VLDLDPQRPLAFSLITNSDTPLSKKHIRRAHEQLVDLLCRYVNKTQKEPPAAPPARAVQTPAPAQAAPAPVQAAPALPRETPAPAQTASTPAQAAPAPPQETPAPPLLPQSPEGEPDQGPLEELEPDPELDAETAGEH
jgi:hypothetical protein